MDIAALVRKWSAVAEPEGTVVTLGLDLSKSGVLPPATRVFLKDQVAGNLESEGRSPAARGVLRKLARRIRALAEKELREGTDGLFLVAGRDVWEPLELGLPMRNFLEVGRTPFLAPLLEAERRRPRAYLVEAGPEGALVSELHLGSRRELGRIAPKALADDVEKAVARRSRTTAGGGAERDLHQRRRREAVRDLLRESARKVAALHRKAPAERVFVAAPPEGFEEFRSHLPSELRDRALPLRSRADAVGQAARELDRALLERRVREEGEFREGRERGLQAALGPREVLESLSAGTLERVYLDPFDALPGVACDACGGLFPELRGTCPYCSAVPRVASMTQEVVARSLAHPSPALAFVPGGATWLSELGGMAGLLRARPARSKPGLVHGRR
jgi:hypothetical protein